MQRIFKLARAKKELNNNAKKHLADAEIPIEAPDAGADEAETLQRLLRSAGGDHRNLRAIYLGGGYFLAVQKALKAYANELGDKIENGEITKEQAVQMLTDRAREAPSVTLRGEGAGTGKRASKAREAGAAEARDQLKAQAQARIESLSGREKQLAERLFAEMFGEA